jgi:hypothetical protein
LIISVALLSEIEETTFSVTEAKLLVTAKNAETTRKRTLFIWLTV